MFTAIHKSLKEMQQLDQDHKGLIHLQTRAIGILTEEVARHKANTKILESLGGKCLSEEEGKELREKAESLQLSWSQADNACKEALAGKAQAEADLQQMAKTLEVKTWRQLIRITSSR